MQSYQGGLGVLIKESDDDKIETENESGLNSIRFVPTSLSDQIMILFIH